MPRMAERRSRWPHRGTARLQPFSGGQQRPLCGEDLLPLESVDSRHGWIGKYPSMITRPFAIPFASIAALTCRLSLLHNDVWFSIGLMGSTTDSSRYIHAGHLSEGCVTVHQLERWTALYGYLISRRVPGSNGKRIGTIEVRK